MPKTITQTRPARRRIAVHSTERTHPLPAEPKYVVEGGRTTYVLVPVEQYEELVKSGAIRVSAQRLEETPDRDWVDASSLGLQLAGERIAEARKQAGLTQQQLAKKLNVPQSQISRIERNPDHTTVRTLKKIAKALGVDIAALL